MMAGSEEKSLTNRRDGEKNLIPRSEGGSSSCLHGVRSSPPKHSTSECEKRDCKGCLEADIQRARGGGEILEGETWGRDFAIKGPDWSRGFGRNLNPVKKNRRLRVILDTA